MNDQPTPIPFVPISRQLLDSSVWETDRRVRVLWITMLMTAAEPARRGTVDMTIRALSGRAAMSPDDVRYALSVLESPDHNSRTPGSDGRRIERIDSHREWGWRILNWASYEKDRERMLHAARQARYRARTGDGSVTVGDGSVTVGDLEGEVEVEVEVEVEAERGAVAPPSPPARSRRDRSAPPTEEEWTAYARASWPEWAAHDIAGAWASYQSRGWRTTAGPVRDWKAAARTCYHRWAGRVATPNQTQQRALIGSHTAPPQARDLDDAPTEIQDIARRIARREDTTEAEDDRYLAAGGGMRADFDFDSSRPVGSRFVASWASPRRFGRAGKGKVERTRSALPFSSSATVSKPVAAAPQSEAS